MGAKIMVHLYYHSKKLCRMDCDVLGIDRRRVITLRNGYGTYVFQDENGNRIDLDAGERPVWKPMVAKLIVDSDLVYEHLDDLHHDDDETWS